MSEKINENSCRKIEDIINEVLIGDTLKNALDFTAFLENNDMIAGGEHGEVSYKGKCVCYMHLGGSTQKPDPWTIWIDGNYNDEQEDISINTHTKELAWANVNICTSCGCGSQPGKRKIIFGKEFDNVCNADMAFYAPDSQTLECVKQLLIMRKSLIDKNKV